MCESVARVSSCDAVVCDGPGEDVVREGWNPGLNEERADIGEGAISREDYTFGADEGALASGLSNEK
jgi:hypothetical protein